jgi:hypothetical protein
MNESFNLGSWIGRRQAFNALSGQALSAETECLRYIRDNRLYLNRTANWPDFCDHYVGISRAQIDRTIQCLDEFGETYFHLSQLIRISPATYRALRPHITDDGLTYNDEVIPISFDEVPRLIAAVNALRPRKPAPPRTIVINTFENIAAQLRDSFARLQTLPRLTPSEREQLAALLAPFRTL